MNSYDLEKNKKTLFKITYLQSIQSRYDEGGSINYKIDSLPAVPPDYNNNKTRYLF